MPKGAIHYTGSNFARLRRLDVVSRVRALTYQRMMQRPQWLTYAERAPPLELDNLRMRCRTVPNKYLTLTRELLQKYPDIRFQDCFVEGNETAKGQDTYRADHPAMQFVALQLRLMNQGIPKAAAFKQAEEIFLERRAELERSQKLHMAAAIAATAAADPAAVGGDPVASNMAPLTTSEGMGLVQPMFTSGRAYRQAKAHESQMKHLLHIRRVLRKLREEAQHRRQEPPSANSRQLSHTSLCQKAFAYPQEHLPHLHPEIHEERPLPALSSAEEAHTDCEGSQSLEDAIL